MKHISNKYRYQILVTHAIEYLKLFKRVLFETRNLLSTFKA